MHSDLVICEKLTKFINLEAIIQISKFGGNNLESLYSLFCINRFYFSFTQIVEILWSGARECKILKFEFWKNYVYSFICFLKFLTIKECFIYLFSSSLSFKQGYFFRKDKKEMGLKGCTLWGSNSSNGHSLRNENKFITLKDSY